MKASVFGIIVFCLFSFVACNRQCTEMNHTFIEQIDQYKKGKDALIDNLAFFKHISHNKDTSSVILWSNRSELKQVMSIAPNKGLESIYNLWEQSLLIDGKEKAVFLYPNTTIYFLVKKCGNIHHYIVYDPTRSISKIGVTDEITYHKKVDTHWEYVIQREK